MKKVYNTVEYRKAKRVTSFLKPSLKKTVLSYAKLHDITISKAIERILITFFADDGN